MSVLNGAPSSPSASLPPSLSPQLLTHVISVGRADHKFEPDVVLANVGDIIEFQFFPPNHSVARAEYKYPCIPYELTGRGKVGFFSGFKPVDAILEDPPQFQLKVVDKDPIFFYCTTPGSCINYRMVGVINPNATTSLEVQKDLASKSAYMLQPGEKFPSENDKRLTDSWKLPKTGLTGTHSPNGLSKGAIAGIVLGSIAVVALIVAMYFMYKLVTKTLRPNRRKNRNFSWPGGPLGIPPNCNTTVPYFHSNNSLVPPSSFSGNSMGLQKHATTGSLRSEAGTIHDCGSNYETRSRYANTDEELSSDRTEVDEDMKVQVQKTQENQDKGGYDDILAEFGAGYQTPTGQVGSYTFPSASYLSSSPKKLDNPSLRNLLADLRRSGEERGVVYDSPVSRKDFGMTDYSITSNGPPSEMYAPLSQGFRRSYNDDIGRHDRIRSKMGSRGWRLI